MNKRKRQIFNKCVQLLNKRHQSQKSNPKKDTEPAIDSSYWLSSNIFTHIIAHESAEKTQINQQWPSPHVVEVESKGFETSFRKFIQINRFEKLSTEMKPWCRGCTKLIDCLLLFSLANIAERRVRPYVCVIL